MGDNFLGAATVVPMDVNIAALTIGTTTVITPPTGNSVRVGRVLLRVGGASSLVFRSLNSSGKYLFRQDFDRIGRIVLDFDAIAWMETLPNEPLVVISDQAVKLSGTVWVAWG